MTRSRAEAALALNALIWGSTFVVVKEALGSVSTLVFLALRFSLAAMVLALVFRRAFADGQAVRKGLRAGAIVGCLLFAGYALQTFGLRYTTAPKSAFLTGLGSVMVPFLGFIVYRNRPRVAELAGLVTATAGMALMTLEPSAGSGILGAINVGDALCFGCAVAFAAHMVALGHFSQEMSFELMSVVQIATAALLAWATCGWLEVPMVRWNAAVIGAILITGLLATALAFTVMAWAQRYTTATRTALIFLMEPVFAWATSYLVEGEGLSGRAAAGAGLILGGVLLVELKPSRSVGHPSE